MLFYSEFEAQMPTSRAAPDELSDAAYFPSVTCDAKMRQESRTSVRTVKKATPLSVYRQQVDGARATITY